MSAPPPSPPAADAVDRGLEPLDDRLGDARVRERRRSPSPPRRSAPPSAAPGRRTRPSPARARPRQRGVRPAHQLVDHPDPRLVARPPPCQGRPPGPVSPVSGRRRNGSTRVRDESRVMFVPCEPWSSRTCTRRPSGRSTARFVLDQVEALRRRGDVEIEVFAFPPGLRAYPAAARAAPPLPPRRVRHRPRALRPDRVAGAARPARPGRRHAARQRPLPPALEPDHARRAAVHGAARRRLARVQREHPGRGDDAARRRAAGRHRPRPLPPDPPPRGARAPRPGPRRALPAVPPRPRPPAQALRPRARGGRRRAAADDGPRRARRGPVLDQRRQRRARARRRPRASACR